MRPGQMVRSIDQVIFKKPLRDVHDHLAGLDRGRQNAVICVKRDAEACKIHGLRIMPLQRSHSWINVVRTGDELEQ